MCIGTPMRVVCMFDTYALCKGDGERKIVDMTLVGEQTPGTWVLEFLGCAREVLTEENAVFIGSLSRALEDILRHGEETDKLFGEFCDREPELSRYLRKTACKNVCMWFSP